MSVCGCYLLPFDQIAVISIQGNAIETLEK